MRSEVSLRLASLLLAVETGSVSPAITPKAARATHVHAWLYFALTESLIHVNKTYINLTQPSIARARQFSLRLASKTNQISCLELEFGETWQLQ